MNKPIFRKETKSTSNNKDSIIDLINDANTIKVTFFATVKETTFNGCTSGENNNLPLMIALVEQTDKIIIHDGLFLTAARTPRYYEVRSVLDVAVTSNKAAYCNEPVKCTSKRSEDDAVAYLLEKSYGKRFMLDQSTRPVYFSLLSSLTEAEMQNL